LKNYSIITLIENESSVTKQCSNSWNERYESLHVHCMLFSYLWFFFNLECKSSYTVYYIDFTLVMYIRKRESYTQHCQIASMTSTRHDNLLKRHGSHREFASFSIGI
jgi:hypothetical protein